MCDKYSAESIYKIQEEKLITSGNMYFIPVQKTAYFYINLSIDWKWHQQGFKVSTFSLLYLMFCSLDYMTPGCRYDESFFLIQVHY